MAPVESQDRTFVSAWTRGRIQLSRYLTILRKRWWILFLTVSLGLCIAAWIGLQLPPASLSVGRMMVRGQIRLNEGSATYTEELGNFYGTQIELMQSGEVQKHAADRVLALHPDLQLEKVKLEVGLVPRTSIFIIRAVGLTPLFTRAYLDACMDEYIATKKEMRSQSSESTTSAIQAELVRLDKEMADNEEKVHAFQKDNNLGYLHEEGNSAALYLTQLNRQLADLKTEYDLLELLDLDQNLDREQATITSPGQTSGTRDTALANYGPLLEYQKAKQQLQMLKSERDDFSRYLRPKHPTIVLLDEQIARGQKLIETFRNQSVETLKTRRESIRLQIENLQDVIKQWEAKALDLSSRVAEFDKIKSVGERTKAQYDRLLTNLRSIDITKNVDQDSISILERASPSISIRPGLVKVMWEGFAIGTLLGLIILFIMDKLDDRISSFVEFRSHFPEHIMGQIPREDMSGAHALLTHSDERHALMESFRTLRSSIIFLPVQGARPKTLMITSTTPSEGKTTVASNLAIILAFSGAKTLLVDADLRRGRLHDLFGVPQGAGFSKVLQQQIPWREAVVDTSIDNLTLLPRGRALAHPAEHLLGKVTDQFLRDFYSEYDYIIFDSAPVMVADDALSLAPKIDGVMFVIRFSQSSARHSRRALELLSHRQVNVLGLICNDVKLSQAEYGYGYYYQYSDSYKERKV
ncbi:MAG: polysaccharide biosynthesis transport protein [Chthoniobacter sp.]|nr:polysaccharide biosynthesis transport protein [Chthoniobacter sp.]